MKALLLPAAVSALIGAAALAQAPPAQDPQPIYRVTVVSRSLEAVNYQHRGGPTPIDFQGTVLMPHAKGTAIVESHRGSVAIDAKLEHMDAPTRFGREYLTYVLWAISPEGRPKNLGELLVDSSNHAHLKATTDFQAFGLMVTAEPYYSVTIPSDVVVAENVVRPDTIGNRELVTAKYELLPRGQYTLNVQPAQLHSPAADGPKLSYDRYEAVLELYQAENAVQIARSLGADQYAPESMSKAAALLAQAQNMDARKMDPQAIVSAAREAAQMAEDARAIAVKRSEDEHHAREVQRLEQQGELRHEAEQQQADAQAAAQAEAEAAQVRAEADAERARAEAAEAHARAVQQAVIAPPPPPQQPAIVAGVTNEAPNNNQRQARQQLLAQLNGNFSTEDSPRGLVITLNDSMFSGDGLRPDADRRLTTVAAVLAAHPELNVRVEGYADTEPLSREHAQAVRDALIARGARSSTITAVGYGDSRPIASNATAAGRQQNRRVEVIVTGASIGNKALWDRGYRLQSER